MAPCLKSGGVTILKRCLVQESAGVDSVKDDIHCFCIIRST